MGTVYKLHELHAFEFCDERYILYEFVKSMNLCKEYDLFRDALTVKKYNVN